jgi:hypothetical protein
MNHASLARTPPAARPLRAAREFELQAQFRRALSAGDGVAGAHCIHEWWMRTAYAPAQRFDQHRAGIRAAGSVLKRGEELLLGPVLHLQRIAQADAARIERELAAALADAGLMVEGGH